MQITLKWTCRECGQEQETRTDTSNYGAMSPVYNRKGNLTEEEVVSGCVPVPLQCSTCNHVSGEVGLGYRFREERRPSHERQPCP